MKPSQQKFSFARGFRMLLAFTAVLGFGCTGASGLVVSNLVQNGSFEAFDGNTLKFPGWVFTGGFEGYIGEPGGYDGVNWIGLSSPVYEDIPTIPGQFYTVSFATRGDDPQQSFRVTTMQASWGDAVLGTDTFTNRPPWHFLTYQVEASSASTRLEFDNLNLRTGFPQLDAVGVFAVVPEPSSLWLCFVGGVIFVCVRRLQRAHIEGAGRDS